MARYKDKEGWEAAGSPRVNPEVAVPFEAKYAEIAERMVAAGANLGDLAFYFGTTKNNLQDWKKENPEFKRAVQKGKSITKAYLIGRAIKSAAGFEYTDRKVITKQKVLDDGSLELIPGTTVTVEETHKTHLPNERLAMYLISALDRQEGKDDWVAKQFVEKKVDHTHVHKLDAAAVEAQIDRLAGGHVKAIESEIIEADLADKNIPENNGES